MNNPNAQLGSRLGHFGVVVVRVPILRDFARAGRRSPSLRCARGEHRAQRLRADGAYQGGVGGDERPLGTRTIVVPIANHGDNQHTFNENLRLQNLWDRIELMGALLAM